MADSDLGDSGGELNAQVVREIGDHRPFGAGVVHRGDPTPALGSPPAHGEQLDGVGELGQVPHPDRADRVAECLPGRITSGQRTGVGGDHGLSGR